MLGRGGGLVGVLGCLHPLWCAELGLPQEIGLCCFHEIGYWAASMKPPQDTQPGPNFLWH